MIFDSSSTIFPQFFPGGPAASLEATWHMAGTRQTVSWQRGQNWAIFMGIYGAEMGILEIFGL